MRLRLWIQPAPPPGAPTALPSHTVDIDLVGDGVFLGRDHGATLELPFPDISGIHARIFSREGRIYFEDLGSTNGSYAGERRLGPHVPLAVGLGETLRLGSIALRLESLGEGAAPLDGLAGGSETLARRLVADLFCACPPAEPTAIQVESGVDAGKTLALLVLDRRYVVGRGPSCDLVVSDPDVSREHVAFLRTAEGIRCLDLGSKNGVLRGGKRVESACLAQDGDRFTLGGTVLRLLDPEDRYLRQMEAAEEEAKAGVRAQAVALVPADVSSPEPESASDSAFKRPTLTPDPEPIPSVASPSVAPPLEKRKSARRSLLPYVVGGVASVVLLGLIGVVLALAFDFWK